MEIHPPSKPVHSVKEFFVHLSMIVIGILIAMGLEQAMQAWHHHELGEQTAADIRREIRANQKKIQDTLPAIPKAKERTEANLAVIQKLLKDKNLKNASINNNVSNIDLSSTSWQSAASTGALAYMKFELVKKFAEAYELQALAKRLQDEWFFGMAQQSGTIRQAAESGREEDLRNAERLTVIESVRLDMMEQVAKALLKEYEQALKDE